MRWILILVAFVLVPLAELWVILSVGDAIGVLPTIGLLLVDSIAGGMLLRWQGRDAWRRFVDALRTARVPSRELADGLLIVVGAALLLTPGFLTDVGGLLLLLPPTRALVRRGLERTIAGRLRVGLVGTAGDARRRPPGEGRGRDYDVEGTATEREDATFHDGRARLER
jgi:UPF0716 protein FxsA